MTGVHKGLAAGRWYRMSFAEQMANIGGEIQRALNWRAKGYSDRTLRSAERALELLDLTIQGAAGFPRLKELARVREATVDYFWGSNDFGSTEDSLSKYFLAFAYAARRNR